MTSRIIVNNIQSDTGVSTVTIASPVALSGGITGTGFTVGTGASISSPATNILALGTNNSERVRIISSGFVGIGTASPASPLEVQSSGIPRIISNYNNSKHIGMSVGGSGGGFTLTDGHFLTINHQPYADRGTDNNLTERVRIDSSGRVTKPYQVYFYARAASGNHTSGTIPYSLVDYNIGNHYNSSTYNFTAPVAGVYNISFQFFSLVNAAGGADLEVNGTLTMRCGREGTETYYEAYSNAINKYLNVGDTVRVQHFTGSVHTNTPFSHFSAYLLG